MTETSDLLSAVLTKRGVLAVSGPEARTFLQGLLTNDLAPVKAPTQGEPGRCVYAGLLTPQGKAAFDMIVIAVRDEDGSESFLLDTAAAGLEALHKKLRLYKLRAKVDLAIREDLAVGAALSETGPQERAAVTGSVGEGLVLRDPRLGALGLRVTAAKEDLAGLLSALAPAGEEAAFDAHRLRLGVGEVGIDVPAEQVFWLELNAEALNGVDFKKGCYVGQELTARMKHKSTLRKRVLPVALEGALPAPGTEVQAVTPEGAKGLGTLVGGLGLGTSGEGPALGLAYVRTDRLEAAGAAPLVAGETALQVIRPEWLAGALSA